MSTKPDKHTLADVEAGGARRRSRFSLEPLAVRSASWVEKWFPDTFVIALLAIVVVGVAAIAIGSTPATVMSSFGNGFWDLLPFAMQMAIIIVGGYALASSKPVRTLIERLAAKPGTARGAVAFVAFCTMVSSLLSWGFSLIVGGLFARAMGRRKDLRVDYRAASAAGFMGIGATCLLGLSSAPALLHATPESVPQTLYEISGYIPLTQTMFSWRSGVLLLVMGTVSVLVAYYTAPTGDRIKTAADLGVDVTDEPADQKRSRPGEWLEYSPLLSIVIGGAMAVWIIGKVISEGPLSAVSDLNSYNFLILTLALLLHWRPRSFVQAASRATPATSGVIIQFPVYAGIAGILVSATNGADMSLSHYLAEAFTWAGQYIGLPVVVGIYSIVMGLFVPSAGAKWALEAPYVFEAATESQTNFGWLVQVYSSTESLANLINPFWMLPLLGLVGLKARNIVGYTLMYFIVLAPATLTAIWVLSIGVPWVPPVFP
ncbi:short-chain fatty acid transporter [Prauserella cavernicola]|uniref:Short-chain fatty acid transporter n=1 Tax=Prauserella cavernicola TaxID=2800127 RepID=A0A934QWT8_9PSEU|nr:TIGR00366 family protein [Prauserella cavernicola]MBK1787820.1 short-chain fatty acid transporter [Prauserella cavernicola]